MYSNYHADVRSVPHPDLALPRFQTSPLVNDSSASAGKRYLEEARSHAFPSTARVAGFLLEADIGPTSYGQVYDCDQGESGQFLQFDVIGFDCSAGYDIVRHASGVGYVIVAYARHAENRGMAHLKEHIAGNADWYAARALNRAQPWLHSRPMVEHLEASWRAGLSPLKAESRIAALYQAQEFIAAK